MELNGNLSKEQIQTTAMKCFKICSTCFTTRKIQIKVTLKDFMSLQSKWLLLGIQMTTNFTMYERMWDHLYAIGRIVNSCSYFGNESRVFL